MALCRQRLPLRAAPGRSRGAAAKRRAVTPLAPISPGKVAHLPPVSAFLVHRKRRFRPQYCRHQDFPRPLGAKPQTPLTPATTTPPPPKITTLPLLTLPAPTLPPLGAKP